MAELDLLGAVPWEVQQAFGEEVAQRAGRRAARAKADAAAADREAARDRSALAATMGPSAAELQARSPGAPCCVLRSSVKLPGVPGLLTLSFQVS